MTTRVLVPAAAFAAGAYSENVGYIARALDFARSLDPNLSKGVDALFGDGATLNPLASTPDVSGDVAVAASKASAIAREGVRDALRGLVGGARDAGRAALGGSMRKSGAGVEGDVTTVKTPVIGMKGLFLVGAIAGFAVVYAYGPERCERAARRVTQKVRKGVEDAKARARAIVERVFTLETRNAIEGALVSAHGAIKPVLKSSADNLVALLEQSKGATTEVAGKISNLIVDVREKYLVVVTAKAKESYGIVLDAGVRARDAVAPTVDKYRRRAREFFAGVYDVIRASLGAKTQ